MMFRLISQKITQFFTSSLTPNCSNTGIIATLNARGLTSLSSLASPKPNWSPRSTWQSQLASLHVSSYLTGNSLNRMHRTGPLYKKRSKRQPLDGCPQKKGVILKTLIKKPKKPNSANRKCVLVRLSNGREAVAYVPGVGHNLQEHNVVLVRCGRLQDVPGVKLKVIRGKYDCAHVKKPTA